MKRNQYFDHNHSQNALSCRYNMDTNVVTAVKSEESDGYKAVQLGYGQVDPTKVTKP